MEQMHERLRWARQRAGYSAARVAAQAIGVTVSTYAAHENGQNGFKKKSAQLYGKAFGVSWVWLLYGTDGPEPSQEELTLYSQMEGPRKVAPQRAIPNQPITSPPMVVAPHPNAIVGTPIVTGVNTIPVYGSAVGGTDGEFQMSGSELGRVFAPPQVASVPSAYAVQIVGDSMEPRYFDGETAYVDPNRRVKRGDFVVAQIAQDESEALVAYVKRFVKHTNEELVLEQFNPPKELRFPHERVHSVHYIAMSGEAIPAP